MPDGAEEANQVAPEETTTDAYKQLQRKLEAARKREKALVEQNLAQTEQVERLESIQSTQTAILSALQKAGVLDTEDVKDIKRSTPGGESGKESRRKIADSLFAAEAQWDDERLDGARRAWNDGKHEEAAKMVATALGAPEDFEAAVSIEVQKRLSKLTNSVDTGASTATASDLSSPRNVGERLQNSDGSLNREYWTANKDAILRNIRSGKLRLAAP